MSPSEGPCADSLENEHSQVEENIFLADEKGPWKRRAGIYLYIHLYYRSVVITLLYLKIQI